VLVGRGPGCDSEHFIKHHHPVPVSQLHALLSLLDFCAAARKLSAGSTRKRCVRNGSLCLRHKRTRVTDNENSRSRCLFRRLRSSAVLMQSSQCDDPCFFRRPVGRLSGCVFCRALDSFWPKLHRRELKFNFASSPPQKTALLYTDAAWVCRSYVLSLHY